MHNSFYSDDYYDERDALCHYGVKGMHWGIRRTSEQLGHRRNTTTAKPNARMRKTVGKIQAFYSEELKHAKKLADDDPNSIFSKASIAEHAEDMKKTYFKEKKSGMIDRDAAGYYAEALSQDLMEMAHWPAEGDARAKHRYDVLSKASPMVDERLPGSKDLDDAKRIVSECLFEAHQKLPNIYDSEVISKVDAAIKPLQFIAEDLSKTYPTDDTVADYLKDFRQECKEARSDLPYQDFDKKYSDMIAEDMVNQAIGVRKRR